MQKIWNNRNYVFRVVLYLLVIVIFASIIFDYVEYMDVAKSTVPIMDFWEWIYVYGQGVLDGSVTFADYFNSDAGQHIQPLCMAINFGMLKTFDFDVVPLVTGGMILRFLMTALLILLFLYRFRDVKDFDCLVQLLCVVSMCMAMLNYNQWEITAEPFSLAFAFRIANYLLTFYFADVFLKGLDTRSLKASLIQATLLGLYCAVLTICVGAAYFVGHLVAIGLAFLWTLICQRQKWRRYIWPMMVWCVISFAAACVYYALVSGRANSDVPSTGLVEYLLLILQGVAYFWGSMFVHSNVVDIYGISLVAILGTLMLAYTLYISVRFLRLHADGSGMFPMMCVIYALIISVVVSYGRVSSFGTQVMTSSRYVVESVIGLVGAIWMSYDVYVHQKKKSITWIKPVAVCLLTIMFMMSVTKSETRTAPYRKISFDNMKEIMINIDDYSDDELGIFQANSPVFVRYCVEFFEENDLSIFGE